jgi:hypothetical protein
MTKLPLIAFLDDGVHVYNSVTEAEAAVEPIDVIQNPGWMAFDCEGKAFRFSVISKKKKWLFGALNDDRVKVVPDNSLILRHADNRIDDQMIDYLGRFQLKPRKQLSRKEIFDLVVGVAQGLKNSRG